MCLKSVIRSTLWLDLLEAKFQDVSLNLLSPVKKRVRILQSLREFSMHGQTLLSVEIKAIFAFAFSQKNNS